MIRDLPTLVCCLICFAAAAPADTPTLLTASAWGTSGDDRLEGVAIAADDGAIYVAGTLSEKLEAQPGKPAPKALGAPDERSQYRHGYVAQLSADGSQLVAHLQFGRGLMHLTTVAVRGEHVYVAGYATPKARFLFALHDSVMDQPDISHKGLTRWAPRVHRHDPMIDADRHDQRGSPIVLRLDRDLTKVTGGTFLEGWQSVWHVPWPLREDQWQPTDLDFAENGDLIVAHDGGIIADHGDDKPDHRHFYHMPDFVSRLSPDLTDRRWKLDIYTPENDPAKVKKHLGYRWPHPTLGNTRIHRLRVSPDGKRFAIVGWSPSETSAEPWWSPFCFIHDTETGKRLRKLYTPSPMAGGGDRMGNDVSDSAVQTVDFDENGHLLLGLKGDGGNTILRHDPRGFDKRITKKQWDVQLWGFNRRELFWGGVVRVDGASGELIRGKTIIGRRDTKVRAAWPIDLTALPDDRVAVATRHSVGFRFTDDAWSEALFDLKKREHPGGSLMLLKPGLNAAFITSIGDVQPTRIASRGDRVVLIGNARSKEFVQKNILMAPAGGTDGYIMVIDTTGE